MASVITADTGAVSGTAGLKQTADSSGVLALATGTGTTAVTIDASQNVGIGTSSPGTKLDVVGTSQAYGFRVQAAINLTGAGIWGLDSVLAFNTSSTERMRIDSSGNLLVNATSQVGAAPSPIGLIYNGASQYGVTIKTSSNNGAAVYFLNSSGTSVGAINLTSTTTAYVTSSDYRLKNTVMPMTGALSRVAALKPVTYKWNADDSDGEGFIAHELAEVCPHAVVGAKDAADADGNPVYQGIDTSFLVATLTAAIQEQQALITTLTERISALEAK